jgi:hypothetical protein
MPSRPGSAGVRSDNLLLNIFWRLTSQHDERFCWDPPRLPWTHVIGSNRQLHRSYQADGMACKLCIAPAMRQRHADTWQVYHVACLITCTCLLCTGSCLLSYLGTWIRLLWGSAYVQQIAVSPKSTCWAKRTRRHQTCILRIKTQIGGLEGRRTEIVHDIQSPHAMSVHIQEKKPTPIWTGLCQGCHFLNLPYMLIRLYMEYTYAILITPLMHATYEN